MKSTISSINSRSGNIPTERITQIRLEIDCNIDRPYTINLAFGIKKKSLEKTSLPCKRSTKWAAK